MPGNCAFKTAVEHLRLSEAMLIFDLQNKPNALANSMLSKVALSIISTLCTETTSEDN